MSVTNAISGMTAAGGMLIMGGGLLPGNAGQALGAAAVALSSVNLPPPPPLVLSGHAASLTPY